MLETNEPMILQIKECQKMFNPRKSNSKVNLLRAQIADLQDKVDYYSKVSSSTINWVHKNCTDEQKEQFVSNLRELADKLAKGE